MNWMSVGLIAVTGAIAAGIGVLFTLNKDDKRSKFGAAFAISFVVLYTIARVAIFPRLDTWYRVHNAEAELLEVPTYQALRKYDRATYDKLLADLKQGLQDGADEAQLIATLRGHITNVVQSRLGSASDHAVIEYMGITVKEMEELNKKGGDLCYRFLFPQRGEVFDPREHFSKKIQDADVAALAEVIRTSAENPLPVPQESQVIGSMQGVFTGLSNEYGDDIMMLQNPTAPTVDRRKVCTMSADMYRRIFALPDSESGPLLRYLVSQ